jgi:hypothetical protein
MRFDTDSRRGTRVNRVERTKGPNLARPAPRSKPRRRLPDRAWRRLSRGTHWRRFSATFRPPRPSRTLGGSSSASTGASGRPALPPTLGGPPEAGQGGLCSLWGQVFYRRRWRDFGPATSRSEEEPGPPSPRFSAASAPGWRCNWVQSANHPRPSSARAAAYTKGNSPYLNFPSNIRRRPCL